MNGKANGKVVSVLDRREGTAKNGREFEVVQCLFEVSAMRAYNFVFDYFRYKDDEKNELPPVGQTIEVTCEVSASSYQGKYYNNVRCINWK